MQMGGAEVKELILFYSFSGKTRRYAEQMAQRDGADLVEVKEHKQRSGFGTVIPGVFQAMGHRQTKIQPLAIDWDAYDRVVLCAPVWSGSPAPAINSVAALLPTGKKVSIALTASGGEGKTEALANIVRARGCEVVSETATKVG